MDIQSCVIFGGLLVLNIVLAWIAQKENRKDVLLLAALTMTLVAGLRATSVGIDTAQYTEQFRLLKLGRFDLVYAMEKSFMYLCSILMIIFRDAHFLFAIFAAVTHGFVLLRLWDFKEDICLPWSVACYQIMFFPESLNVMRQLIAIAIVFYATRYISKKKYTRFLVYVGVAFLFHNSALIGLGFLGLDAFVYWHSIDKEKRAKILKISVKAGIVLLIIGVILFFALNIGERYDKYLTNIKLNFGLMMLVKLFFLIGTIILMHNEMKELLTNRKERRLVRNIETIRIYYGLGIMFTSLGYILENAHRIGWYYAIMECVYFGIIVKEGKYHRLFQIGVMVILLYTFFKKLSGGSNGEIPYRFLWQV